MKKLRLDMDEIRVETFSSDLELAPGLGSIIARAPTSLADGCTADLECYTADPRYTLCTGGNPCTNDHRCTNIGTCAVETAYCD